MENRADLSPLLGMDGGSRGSQGNEARRVRRPSPCTPAAHGGTPRPPARRSHGRITGFGEQRSGNAPSDCSRPFSSLGSSLGSFLSYHQASWERGSNLPSTPISALTPCHLALTFIGLITAQSLHSLARAGTGRPPCFLNAGVDQAAGVANGLLAGLTQQSLTCAHTRVLFPCASVQTMRTASWASPRAPCEGFGPRESPDQPTPSPPVAVTRRKVCCGVVLLILRLLAGHAALLWS